MVDEDRRARLDAELGRRLPREPPRPRGVELVGRGEVAGGALGGLPQGLQQARGRPRHPERLGLADRHLAQAGEYRREVRLAQGGHVVVLARPAGHLGVQRVGEAGCPLAVRHARRQRDRDVRPHQFAQAQFAASARRGLPVRGQPQDVPGADPPRVGFDALGDRPDVGLRAPAQQGAD
ncbi:hypothetical protein STENM327S_02863 [Streptomyces tendae]